MRAGRRRRAAAIALRADDYTSRVKQKRLTPQFINSVKKATDGTRAEFRDTEVKAFALRVTKSGAKSYVMNMRWPGSKVPVRRTIGDADAMTLADARKIAREWLALVEKGIDPREKAREEAEAEARERAITFASVAEDYISEFLADKRRGAKSAQEIRRDVVPAWGDLPVASITSGHVIELAKDLKRKSPTGRNILSHIKSIFGWALHEHDKIHGNRYGLKDNPATTVNPRRVFGKKKPRERTLDNDELRALLVACREVGYPDGSCVELLLHTGCRREEIARLTWSEVHDRLLVIPPERFKSGVSHRVPLSIDAAALVDGLPRHTGPYVFTTTLGAKAISGWSRAKQEIDRVMTRFSFGPCTQALGPSRYASHHSHAHGRARYPRERRR